MHSQSWPALGLHLPTLTTKIYQKQKFALAEAEPESMLHGIKHLQCCTFPSVQHIIFVLNCIYDIFPSSSGETHCKVLYKEANMDQ